MEGEWRVKESGLCWPGQQFDRQNCHNLHDVVCGHLDLLVLVLVLENVVAWLQNLGDYASPHQLGRSQRHLRSRFQLERVYWVWTVKRPLCEAIDWATYCRWFLQALAEWAGA